MGQRTKTKEIKAILSSANTGNLNSMFEEMVGVKDAEPAIIIPKLVQTRNIIKKIYRIFDQLGSSVMIKSDFPNTEEGLGQIKKYASELKESIFWTTPDEETASTYENVDKATVNQIYKKLKSNDHVKQLITLCSKLKQYKQYIDDKDKLRDNFVGQEPGLSFMIFDFASFDLKKIWAIADNKPLAKKYILTILHLLYKETHAVYKITSSPDVDIDQFVELLMSSIKQLRKQPGLHRCVNAFRRIESSISLLKDKFDDYYRESVASENPNMLVESFIIDVSNAGGADAKLTREFREIIKYMHKMGNQNGKNNDPNVRKLFKMLNQNFNIMEKKTGLKSEGDVIPNMDDAEDDAPVDTTESKGESFVDLANSIPQNAVPIGTTDDMTLDTPEDLQDTFEDNVTPVKLSKAQKRKQKRL